MTTPQAQAYLQRIHLPTAPLPPPTLPTLRRLQRAHMEAVPFENLDVYHRVPLSLNPDGLHDKIVRRRRGGYCFELNGHYADLLRTLGFDVSPRLARVWLRDPAETPTRNHLTHVVTVDGRPYLTDVGFGGYTARAPFPIDTEAWFDDGEGRVRVRADERFGRMFEREVEGVAQAQYSFDESHVCPQDIAAANHWMEHHPVSHFRQNRFVARFTPEGRVGMYDGTLTTRRYVGGRHEKTTEEVGLGEAYVEVLRERFGVEGVGPHRDPATPRTTY